jgi:hypothetical protein
VGLDFFIASPSIDHRCLGLLASRSTGSQSVPRDDVVGTRDRLVPDEVIRGASIKRLSRSTSMANPLARICFTDDASGSISERAGAVSQILTAPVIALLQRKRRVDARSVSRPKGSLRKWAPHRSVAVGIP